MRCPAAAAITVVAVCATLAAPVAAHAWTPPAAPFACIGSFEQCPGTGECVLDPSLCGVGSCTKGQYLCPMSRTECVSADDYAKCTSIANTWLDPTLPDAKRLDMLVAATNVTTQAMQLQNAAPAVPELGIPEYQWLNDDEHGIRQPYGTIFPSMCTLGASWDAALFGKVGAAIGMEARGIHNGLTSAGTRGINPRINAIGVTAYAPMINLAWNPFWGRNQESAGEEPRHVGDLFEQFVIGWQSPMGFGRDALPNRTLGLTCAKHYAANIFESVPATRFNGTSTLDAHSAFEYHLGVFQQLVAGPAQVAHLMCSYNSITDTKVGGPAIPTCADPNLLNGLLRKTWGRSDDTSPVWVVSDYDAFANIVSPTAHDLCANPQDYECAAAMVINAGADQEGGGNKVISQLPAAVSAGTVTAEAVATSFRRLFAARLRLGFHDPPTSTPLNYVRNDSTVVQSVAHLTLARQGAAEGTVLLQNKASALPLQKAQFTSGSKVALIGWHAFSDTAILGNYDISPGPCSTPSQPRQQRGTGDPERGCVVTLYDGLTNNLPSGTVESFPDACKDVTCADQSGWPAAVAAASDPSVGAVVFALGLTYLGASGDARNEREGHDRTDLSLYPGALELLDQLSAAAAKNGVPVVAVLVHGGPVLVQPVMSSAAAVVDVHYPGIQGGNALYDVLFGDAPPAGRLSNTYYSSNEAAITPETSPLAFQFYATHGATYRYLADGGPAAGNVTLPFGYGLSYTSFEYKSISVAPAGGSSASVAATIGVCDDVEATVSVANTGSVDSDEVVQLYLTAYPSGGNPTPAVRLAGFARVHIAAGTTESVSIKVRVDDRFAVETSPGGLWEPVLSVFGGDVELFAGGGQPAWVGKGTGAGVTTSFTAGSPGQKVPMAQCSQFYPPHPSN